MKKLQILGTGCPKCQKLAEHTQAAAEAAGIDFELVKVTQVNEITKFGVMMTPALAIDGEIAVCGRVPDVAELTAMLK